MTQIIEKELSYRIAGCVFEVYRGVGPGLLEKVYERALARELSISGIICHTQVPLTVTYTGYVVGDYIADMIVEDVVILELKAQQIVLEQVGPQLINYLRIANKPLGMLINFHYPKATISRFVNSDFLE